MTYKPKGGRGVQMTTRITGETRAALEAEAERTGRSLAQVAELWLEAGRFWLAFQRQIITEAETLPTPDEIKAAMATIGRLHAIERKEDAA